MTSLGVVATLTLLMVAAKSETYEHPIVQTNYGNVLGSTRLSRNGRTYYSFTGIPYAKPPVGEFRFKTPQEIDPWHGTWNAQNDAPHCIQKNYFFSNPKVEGQEDCLYLNMFTPQIRLKRDIDNDDLLPVMVFIHWGGFFAGYSSTEYLGPEYFMDQNIILVTFNYRLGVMGFLSTNDDAAPGNYGFKDQVAVLKWVNKNVGYFGGNSKKVTLFGQSAGGASVHYHILSPLSNNLFHRGISQSGNALALWSKAYGKEQLVITKQQAKISGCNPNGTNLDIVECLRRLNAKDLVDSSKKFKYFSIDPITIYMPSIETVTEKNPDAFITKTAEEYIKNGEFKNIPWIIGLANDEGLIRAEPLVRQSATRSILDANFDKLMPNLMGLQASVPPKDIGETWEKIKAFYFKGKSGIDAKNPDSVKSLTNLYTDRSFAYSAYQSALYHKFYHHDKIWFYNFNYKGANSYGDLFAATNDTVNYPWGVSHCDDLIYLFKSPVFFSKELNAYDRKCSENLVNIWVNFATYGTPTKHGGKWSELDNFVNNTNKNLRYLNIHGSHTESGPKYHMASGLHSLRIKFWESLPLFENLKELNETVVSRNIK